MNTHGVPSEQAAPLGLLIKSYREDFHLAERLIASINRYNVDNLPVWIVVPDIDLELFLEFDGKNMRVLPESVLGTYLVNKDIAGIRPGYINQEIIKISFWELGLADNYLPIDSDAVMIREFHVEDFMWNEEIPFTVLVEDLELKVDPEYYATYWQGREKSLRQIQKEVGLEDRRLLTCHGHQVFATKVLRSLKEDFMTPREMTYSNLLEIAPYEFSWYNFWLQKNQAIPIHIREPFIKVAHTPTQHLELALKGVTQADLARGYVGVVINSNFTKSWSNGYFQEHRAVTLARYLSWKILFSTMMQKFRNSIKYWFNFRNSS